MLDWKHVLHQAAYQVEEQFDRLRYQLKERLGYSEPIQIVPYRGFGSKQGAIQTLPNHPRPARTRQS